MIIINKLSISRSNAISLACAAAITRLFFGIVIDSPDLYHSGWMSIILGGILSTPVFLCMNHLFRNQRHNCSENSLLLYTVRGLFLINAVLDGAITARFISSSASYVAFNHAIRFFLLLPLFAVVLWSLVCGGDGCGASARLWIKVFPAFFVVILLSQMSKYRWTWLTPVLGPGINEIINGAVDAAGWITSSAGILLFASDLPDKNDHAPNLLKTLFIIVLSTVILTILRYMMAPGLLSSTDRTRIYQLDIMLTNGRAPLILQLPLIIVWFVSLFNLLLCDALIAAIGISKLFPNLKPIWCSAITVIGLLCLSMSRITERISVNVVSQWQYVLNGSAIAVYTINQLLKGKVPKCA